MRYIFESIRPEIQQYFIESDEDAVPYSRSMRSTIYQRSKGQDDTKALGTRRNVYGEGYEWGAHSMWPVDHHEVETRTIVSDELLSIVVVLWIANPKPSSLGADRWKELQTALLCQHL